MARRPTNSKRGGRKRLTKDRKSFRAHVRSQLLSGNTNDARGGWRTTRPGEEEPFTRKTHGIKGGKVKSHFPELRKAVFISCAEQGCETIPAPKKRYECSSAEYCLRHR